MLLQTKVVSLLLAVFVLYLGFEYGIQRVIILPSFERLEQDEAVKDMERAVQAIEREMQHLSVSATDWATWDDTYRFVQDRNPDYVEKNLNLEAMKSLRVNALVIFDSVGTGIWGAIYDLKSAQELTLAELPLDRLPPTHPLLALANTNSEVKGLLQTEHGLLLLASRPIPTSAREGPIRGALVLGWFLDQAAVRAISEQARVALTVTPARASALSPEEASLLTQLEPRSALHIAVTEELLHVYSMLPDLYGKPAALLRVDVARSILAQGRHTVAHAVLSTLVVGLIVLLVLMAVLQRSVLAPIRRLTQHAIAIGQKDDLRSRLAFKRKDELGMLAGEFDRMVDARRRLLDQSYRSGIAEMASGVLHNIGNALTPMTVQVAGLQSALKAAPVVEMDLATAELATGVTTAERRADLYQFLELAGQELANMVRQVAQEVESLSRQIQHVSQILADQEHHSHAARVLEPVDVEDIVLESIQMLAPQMRTAMAVEVDLSVRRVGKVLASRASLQQVVTNLLVNAAESILGNGMREGHLRVHAVDEQVDGRAMSHLYFEDNGGGIPKEYLTRIFEQGFSTKGRGSGLGLHWSANTVSALNGRLYAESAGPGQGACLHLVLPLAGEEP
jgi:sensor domain CHASE-containing protein